MTPQPASGGRRWAPRALAALAVAAGVTTTGASGPGGIAGAGHVDGLVRLVATTGQAIQSGAYPARRVSATARPVAEMSHVVVFLKGAGAAGPLPVMSARMVQRDERFEPAVVAVTRGSTVEFPNADPYFHNVFSLSRAAAFDLGRYRRGDSRTRTFAQAGLVKVYCHLHSHMAASILVFDHPYFVIPDADGRFALPDLPPAAYELVAWHERIGESAQPIRVEAGRTSHAEFTLPVVTP